MRVQILASLLAVAVTACASGSPRVEMRAVGPLAPATFRVSAPPADGDAAGRRVDRQVAAALVAKGLMEAGAEQAADYTVEVAIADRPNGVGAAIPEAQGPATPIVAAQRRSLARPFVRGASAVTVRILETGAGRELYAASATRPHRNPRPELAAGLVDAALKPLQVMTP
ncbi:MULTISPECIES: hypothetical protein [unclassified Phenylobacterium]|uniref:hypothetical protein n=1 Tax=unclassified Phenylobacterium TaxID=2640670 RepID=UPI00083A171B|nr:MULTISPECIES: hypothetical protein [unclassified Phenylobacterium]